MLKYLLGTENGIRGKDLGKQGGVKPEEVEWQDNGTDGKLDLVVTTGLPSLQHLPVLRYCPANRHGMKKTT